MSRLSPEEIIIMNYVGMMALHEIKNAQNGIPSHITEKMELDGNINLINDLKDACYEAYCEYLDDVRFQDMAYGND